MNARIYVMVTVHVGVSRSAGSRLAMANGDGPTANSNALDEDDDEDEGNLFLSESPDFTTCGRLSFVLEEDDERGEEDAAAATPDEIERSVEKSGSSWVIEEEVDKLLTTLLVRIVGVDIVPGLAGSKHVIYVIVILKPDCEQQEASHCCIERRYSDFLMLHRSLTRNCPGLAKGLALPPKLLFRNYAPEIIQKRREALQTYLTKIAENLTLRQRHEFLLFCCGKEMKQAAELTCQRAYTQALDTFLKVLAIQAKLLGDAHIDSALTCCHITALYFTRQCHIEKAILYGSKALKVLDGNKSHPYYIPLLRCMIKAYCVVKDTEQAESLQHQLLLLTTSPREKSLLQLACDCSSSS